MHNLVKVSRSFEKRFDGFWPGAAAGKFFKILEVKIIIHSNLVGAGLF